MSLKFIEETEMKDLEDLEFLGINEISLRKCANGERLIFILYEVGIEKKIVKGTAKGESER